MCVLNVPTFLISRMLYRYQPRFLWQLKSRNRAGFPEPYISAFFYVHVDPCVSALVNMPLASAPGNVPAEPCEFALSRVSAQPHAATLSHL